ncbi:MAG: hypothetical protein K2Y23_24625 [Cyanobacteria bacterium]|nr:hypothetical protein [Cyanobacteriota bacterium]
MAYNRRMVMKPGLRRFALTAHVTSPVGWLGSVAAFLAVALVALSSADDFKARSASTTMELIGWFVIVPFSGASLLSGVIQSLGTQWGLLRHYWVIAKLLITVGASLLLMLHMQVVSSIALAASNDAAASSRLQGPKVQVVADAGAAVIVLLIAAVLSIYKPAGRTDEPAPRWVRVAGAVVAPGVIAFIFSHVAGGGMHGRH